MKSLIDLAQRLSRLPLSEQLFIVHAWVLLAAMGLLIRIIPFDRLLAKCQKVRAGGLLARVSTVPLPRAIQLMEAANRHQFFATTCLTETLAFSRLLAGRGMATTFRIGVSRHDRSLNAHAWLERNGAVLADTGDTATYVPLQPLRQSDGIRS